LYSFIELRHMVIMAEGLPVKHKVYLKPSDPHFFEFETLPIAIRGGGFVRSRDFLTPALWFSIFEF